MNRHPQVVLITGVAGFLGRYITRQFAADEWSIVSVDHHAGENALFRSLNSYHDMELPSTASACWSGRCSRPYASAAQAAPRCYI